jgi:hypothetical protein
MVKPAIHVLCNATLNCGELGYVRANYEIRAADGRMEKLLELFVGNCVDLLPVKAGHVGFRLTATSCGAVLNSVLLVTAGRRRLEIIIV